MYPNAEEIANATQTAETAPVFPNLRVRLVNAYATSMQNPAEGRYRTRSAMTNPTVLSMLEAGINGTSMTAMPQRVGNDDL